MAQAQHKRRKVSTDAAAGLGEELVPDGALGHTTEQSFKVPGLIVTNHHIKVPLDHSGEVPGEITLFVREVTLAANTQSKKLPVLLYLQGGPGFEAPRPGDASGWLRSALNSFRVLLLDQRGTGRSTPVTVNNLVKQGSPAEQAQYLSFFRGDSIVRDAEIVRKRLVPKDNLGGRMSILGQSYGGFCAVAYLSLAPEGLTEVLITGGIPPGIDEPCSAEAVYRATHKRVLEQNRRYYSRYPADVAAVQRIVSYLASQPEGGVRLPSGTLLTPRALQTLGLSGLGSGGGFERLHYLLESFFDGDDQINPTFIKGFEAFQSWDTNPLYALLHEAIYCQTLAPSASSAAAAAAADGGAGDAAGRAGDAAGCASAWAAQRVRDSEEFQSEYDALEAVQQGGPVNFTGEMVYPWFFEDFAALRPYKAVADLLAAKSDWGRLYDAEVLRANRVPVAAATYVEDMYVDFHLAQATASHIKGLRQWMTNEYKHSGIRDDGTRVFDRLINMVRDAILLE